jgi:hypothetical protein
MLHFCDSATDHDIKGRLFVLNHVPSTLRLLLDAFPLGNMVDAIQAHGKRLIIIKATTRWMPVWHQLNVRFAGKSGLGFRDPIYFRIPIYQKSRTSGRDCMTSFLMRHHHHWSKNHITVPSGQGCFSSTIQFPHVMVFTSTHAA